MLDKNVAKKEVNIWRKLKMLMKYGIKNLIF